MLGLNSAFSLLGLCDGQCCIVTGFMEAQVNSLRGSCWGPEDSFIKHPSPTLTIVSSSVVEKVRKQTFIFCHV
jgi:hypothetical protein